MRFKLIIYGSKEALSGLIAHMISWIPTPFMVQTWKWQHRASCGANLIESFYLIEFHCSNFSVSASAQVALTAATRHHLGLWPECMHSWCRCRSHCQCPAPLCDAMMSQLRVCPKHISAVSFYLLYLFQTIYWFQH